MEIKAILVFVYAYTFFMVITYLIYKSLSNKQFGEEELRKVYLNQSSVILRNASIEETKIHTKILLESTKKPINIISGSLKSSLYCLPEIKERIKNQVNEGNVFNIFTYKNSDKDSLKFFQSLNKKQQVKIHFLDEYPKHHIIVSKPYFRVEDGHSISAKRFKATVGKDEKLSSQLEEFFSAFSEQNIKN